MPPTTDMEKGPTYSTKSHRTRLPTILIYAVLSSEKEDKESYNHHTEQLKNDTG